MKRHPGIRYLFFVLFALTLTSPGCEVESQKARDVFASGNMPRVLERISNQFYELTNIVGLTERVELDQTRTDLLRVGVIDEGVDLAHPDLNRHIAFDMENGRLVGAGYDVMGEDRWASANLINPTFFAFGARAIEGGKIVGEPEAPLDLMKQVNEQFMSELVAKINAHPILKESLFNRLRESSMTIFGVTRLMDESRDERRSEAYASWKKEGLLINQGVRERMADPELRKKILRIVPPHYLASILDQEWVMRPNDGVPQFDASSFGDTATLLLAIEHADLFFELLKNHLAEFNNRVGFDKMLNTYLAYAVPKQRAANKERAIGDLQKALYFKLHGPSSLDPVIGLRKAIHDLHVQQSHYFRERDDMTTRPFDAEQTFHQAIERYKEMLSYLDKLPTKPAKVTRLVREFSESLPAVEELIAWYKSERPFLVESGSEPQSSPAQASMYRRHFIRSEHPFVSKKSATASHGTHVSGIIARQNEEKIRITPVRVITQSMKMSETEKRAERSQFKAELKTWLSNPVVFRALSSRLNRKIPGLSFDDASASGRERVASTLMRLLDEKIEISNDANPLDVTFINEVAKAIEYVGKSRVKIANISLGTSFSRAPVGANISDPMADLEQFYDFLRFEFFKWKIGEVAHHHASQTLFVVAAGNEGNWVDGKSRSALPVDLSSPFLAEFEDREKGEVAPNNLLKNILAVGSVSPDENLSSFTNLLLGSKTPYILDQGESILSPIKSTDQKSIQQVIASLLPALNKISITDVASEQLEDFYKSKTRKLEGNESEYLSQREVAEIYSQSEAVLTQINAAISLHLFLKYPNLRAKLTGTSMATPRAAGQIADQTIKRAEQMGLTTNNLYDHPAFTPQKLIEDAFQNSRPLKGTDGKGIPLSALYGGKDHPTDPQVFDVENLIRAAKEKALGRQIGLSHLLSPELSNTPIAQWMARMNESASRCSVGFK